MTATATATSSPTTAPAASTPEPAGDIDPRIARSRAKLLAAATELLVNDGIRAITVDAVAERSGVAKSTLYRHWGSARELVQEVLVANCPAPAEIDLGAGFDAAIRAWMDRSIDQLRRPDWPRILVALLELGHYDPDLAEVLSGQFDDQLVTLGAVLELGAAEGRIPAGLDPRQVTYTLAGPLVLAAVSGQPDSVTDLADYVLTTFLAAHS